MHSWTTVHSYGQMGICYLAFGLSKRQNSKRSLIIHKTVLLNHIFFPRQHQQKDSLQGDRGFLGQGAPSPASHLLAPPMCRLKGMTGPWITRRVGGKLSKQRSHHRLIFSSLLTNLSSLSQVVTHRDNLTERPKTGKQDGMDELASGQETETSVLTPSWEMDSSCKTCGPVKRLPLLKTGVSCRQINTAEIWSVHKLPLKTSDVSP